MNSFVQLQCYYHTRAIYSPERLEENQQNSGLHRTI